MNEQREKVRCRICELTQWSDRANCRRCGSALPDPVVKIVERVVEKVGSGRTRNALPASKKRAG